MLSGRTLSDLQPTRALDDSSVTAPSGRRRFILDHMATVEIDARRSRYAMAEDDGRWRLVECQNTLVLES